MKNNEKQTKEDPKSQKNAQSLSEAELDKVAGGGGPQVPALPVKNPVSAPPVGVGPVKATKKP
jgi:hypothetical protein